jgi:hypothetical protein
VVALATIGLTAAAPQNQPLFAFAVNNASTFWMQGLAGTLQAGKDFNVKVEFYMTPNIERFSSGPAARIGGDARPRRRFAVLDEAGMVASSYGFSVSVRIRGEPRRRFLDCSGWGSGDGY